MNEICSGMEKKQMQTRAPVDWRLWQGPFKGGPESRV